jgi:SAM-dependent methyltransferase
MEESASLAEETIVTERSVEVPWVLEKLGRGGRMLDIGCVGSEYLGEMASRADEAHGLDVRPLSPVQGVRLVRGDVVNPPFKPGSFDVITSISTVEHVGCDFYGQIPYEGADIMAMRQMRRLLRSNGRLLISVPYGRGGVYAWFRVYSARTFRGLIEGFRPLSLQYFRRNGNQYQRCRREEIDDADFDFAHMRSDGLVAAELTRAPWYRQLWRVRRLWRSQRIRRILRRQREHRGLSDDQT